MAATVAEMAAGKSTLAMDGDGFSQLPVTWDTTEDAIEHAMAEEPDLVSEVCRKFDSEMSFTPDRNLNIDGDDDSVGSEPPGGMRDSDTASNSSSARDTDEGSSVTNSDGGARPKQNGASKTVITVNSNSAISSQVTQIKDEILSGVSSQAKPSSASSTKSSSKTDQSKVDSSENGSASGMSKKDSSKSDSSGSRTRSGKSQSSSKDSHRKSSLDRKPSAVSTTASDAGSVSSGGKTGASSSKNPLNLLRRLTKYDKGSKKRDNYKSEFSAVVIDRLPQVFVAKYLGHRPVTGVCGLHHVRKPVDQLVRAIKDKIEGDAQAELPLLYVVVSPKGIDLREHKRNKVKGVAPTGMLPIDFISYGVQDIKFWRVFTCIVVQNMSSQSSSRTASCHAFLCDSAYNGRKMALALGAAFGIYSKKLQSQGRENNFRVELRPPDEIADELELDV